MKTGKPKLKTIITYKMTQHLYLILHETRLKS
jgi:hypothetical protein